MTTQRRGQANEGDGGLPTDIDSLLEKQIKQEKTRKEYQQRPDVMAKRKDYQSKQNDQRKIARFAMKGDTAGLEALGYTSEQAGVMINRAKELAS